MLLRLYIIYFATFGFGFFSRENQVGTTYHCVPAPSSSSFPSFPTSNTVQILQKHLFPSPQKTKPFHRPSPLCTFLLGRRKKRGKKLFVLFSACSLKQLGRQKLSWIFPFNTLNLSLFLISWAPAKYEFQMLQDYIYCCLGSFAGSPYGVRARGWVQCTGAIIKTSL